jgi:predicted Rossmann-fold nucleotide-binding protein
MLLKKRKVIREIEDMQSFMRNGYSFDHICVQDIDFTSFEVNWEALSMEDTCFLGCHFNKKDQLILQSKGVMMMPKVYHLPFNPYRGHLYTWQELEDPSIQDQKISNDLKIYNYFSQTKFNPEITDALWQRIHDHAIDDAMRDLIQANDDGTYNHKCVGFMGGHGVGRNDPDFTRVAQTARILAKAGYFIVSGGGPGIMEAANLGAYFSIYPEQDLLHAIELLSEAPHYRDASYQDQARSVLNLFPEGAESLAIPTWFYGHEPSNFFAAFIAKYFSNSIREDTLLAICLHGIVYAPGSAGTVQEIFMDATQNHYGSLSYISPMVFLGKEHYIKNTGIFPLLNRLAEGRRYKELLFISDEPAEVLEFIEKNPPFIL